MTMDYRFLRRLAALALLPLAAAACEGDPTEPEIAERLVLTVNSLDNSLSLVPVDGGSGTQPRAVDLGAQGSPVGVAARGRWAVVPLGTYPFAAVVDLREGVLAATVPLPANSGATGQAFVNDTLAVVANPGRNTISPVRVEAGVAGAEVQVGTYPAAIVSDDARIYVINGNLVNFAPAGPGSVTVLDDRLRVIRTVQLSGLNPSAGTIIGNRLYVLNSGTFNGNNGSLSVVDLQTLTEVSHHTGFGSFPGSIAASPEGDVYVGIYGTGVVVWDPQSASFTVPLADAIEPDGSTIVSGIGFDYAGRLHTADSGFCDVAGRMYRLTPTGTLEREVTVGICPFGIDFADVPEDDGN